MSGIKRNLPNNEYQAAVGANAPSSANVYATMLDVGGGAVNIYNTDGSLTGTRQLSGSSIYGLSYLQLTSMLYQVEPPNGVTGWELDVDANLMSGGNKIFRIFNNDTAVLKEWFSINKSGAFLINEEYILPLADGNAGEVMTTDGAGNTNWTPASVSPSLVNISATDTFTTVGETLNCTSGTFTVNLPTAVGIQGTTYTLVNSGTGVITLDASTTETINGSLTIDLAQYISRTVQSDGTNWIII